jgi:GT2 family glycosyltransferase
MMTGKPSLGQRSSGRGMTPRLTVVIVNYNKGPLLLACLDSVYKAAATTPPEVIVVDNASTDGVVAVLPTRYPGVRAIRNTVNVGFARAVNQGLAVARATTLVLLNPDTVVLDGALEALAAYLEAHRDVGAVGPQLLDTDGSIQLSCRAFPGYATALFGRYGLLTRWFPRNPFSRRYLLSDWDHAETRDVDWVSGACLATRRDVLDGVGLLDERFFLFNEDVDLCKRIRDGGWRVVYLPEARVVHHIGASRERVPARLVIARHRGMVHYQRKHLSRGPLVDRLVAGLIWARCGGHLLVNALRRR